jgi:hypothetical protein
MHLWTYDDQSMRMVAAMMMPAVMSHNNYLSHGWLQQAHTRRGKKDSEGD